MAADKQHTNKTEAADKGPLQQAIERTIEYTPIGTSDPIKLTEAMAYKYFAIPTKSGQLPSKELVMEFMMLCRSLKLNPWSKDAYLVGYDSKDGPSFSIITAYQALRKRAEMNPEYDGLESGIIVEVDGKIEERVGAFRMDHERLVGGWAVVYRKDRTRPIVAKLMRGPYDTGYSYWKKNPDLMIEKCAKSAAMREAFPLELGGLYIEEEARQEVLPRAIEETERQRKEAKPASKPSVTMSDLTRSPETPAERQLKAAKEFELDVRRCMTVDDVNDARERWLERTSNEEEFDRINLACDKRIQTLLASQEKVVVGTGGELFDHHPNAAEA